MAIVAITKKAVALIQLGGLLRSMLTSAHNVEQIQVPYSVWAWKKVRFCPKSLGGS